MLKNIQQYRQWQEKIVLVRVDFNVPLHKKKIIDDSRIIATLPTIEYLREKGAIVVLMTHVGRPDGRVVKELSVTPIQERLSQLLERPVTMLQTKDWRLSDRKKIAVLTQLHMLQAGDVAILENIRFSAKDEMNDDAFAQELATLADVYVFDGFGVAHRDSASVNGVAAYLPAYAGLLLQKEVLALNKVINPTRTPLVAILGGAKMETKIPIMTKLLPVADRILIGGCLLTTYLWAAGYGVGNSLIEKAHKKDILAACRSKKVLLPLDVVVGDRRGLSYRVVQIEKKPHMLCKKGEAIFDIGPKTILAYAKIIKQAQTLILNGALGYYEQSPYHIGTLAIARLIASQSKGKAFGVIGGGETIDAMQQTGMIDDIDHVSTGGGAMLSYLSGDVLPGIAVVSK